MARNFRTSTMNEVRPGVWRLRVKAGVDPETGHARQLSRTVTFDRKRGTKSEAAEALRAFAAEVKDDKRIGTTATVGKLLTDWLATLERLGKARSTVETYRMHVEKHVGPGLGAKRLDRLTVHDIDVYLAALADKGLAPRTIKLNHSVLRAALEQGVDWGWIKDNPAKRARLKSTGAKVKKPFTAEHLGQLRQASRCDLPWALDAGGGRCAPGAPIDLLAEPPNRYPKRRRRLGRRTGRCLFRWTQYVGHQS
jgi:hypothetical protein